MVRREQVIDGLMSYIETEIIPTLGGWQGWAARTALILAYPNAGAVLTELLNSNPAKMLGLVDNDGMIDIDKAVTAAKEVAQKHGKLEVDIPGFGIYKFGESDFDALATHIKQSNA